MNHYSKKSSDFHADTEDSSEKRDEAARDREIEELLADLDLEGGPSTADEVIAALSADDDWSKNVSGPEQDRSKNVSEERSKNVSTRVRRSPTNDAKIIEKMRNFRVADLSAASLSSVGESPESLPYPSPSISGSQTTPIPSNDNLPVWEKTGDDVAAVCACVALQLAETPPVAFTFNLTPEAIEKSLAHPAGFLDALKRPFDQNLRRAGIKLDYFFVIDIDDDGRLHIHGGFSYPDQTMSIGVTRRIRAIMKKSWGKWTAPGDHKQVHFQRLRDDDWATYCRRNQSAVRKIIGNRTFTISQTLRAEAESSYNAIRSILREDRYG